MDSPKLTRMCHIREIVHALRHERATDDEIINATIDLEDNISMLQSLTPIKETPKKLSKRTVDDSLEKKTRVC